MKLFSVVGYYNDGYSYNGIKEVWTLATNSQEASNKATLFYNAQYDTIFEPKMIVEIEGNNIIFNSIEKF